MMKEITMEELVNYCKQYGFIFQGSEIYGGLANTWDYGPLGAKLKNNIKDTWRKRYIQERKNAYELDAAILMHPKVWEASGHVSSFTDPLIDCKKCKTRHRADNLIDDFDPNANADGMTQDEMLAYIKEHKVPCPNCGGRDFTDIRQFNLMFETKRGVTEDKQTQTITMIDKIVEVSKIDSITKGKIKGAELMIIDENGNIIDSWETSQENHKVKGLEEGKKYKLVEKNAPYGYELAKEIEFIVTEDKQNQIVEMEDVPILTDIKVNKIDSETKEIIKDRFTFAIYEDKECTKLIKEIEANKNDGFVIFKDLRYGEYYIKEIKAPKNYNLSNEVIKVEINDEGVFINEKLIEEDNEKIYSFEIENTKIETPKTNDNRNQTMLSIIASISAISLVGIGIYKLIQKRKNK